MRDELKSVRFKEEYLTMEECHVSQSSYCKHASTINCTEVLLVLTLHAQVQVLFMYTHLPCSRTVGSSAHSNQGSCISKAPAHNTGIHKVPSGLAYGAIGAIVVQLHPAFRGGGATS